MRHFTFKIGTVLLVLAAASLAMAVVLLDTPSRSQSESVRLGRAAAGEKGIKSIDTVHSTSSQLDTKSASDVFQLNCQVCGDCFVFVYMK